MKKLIAAALGFCFSLTAVSQDLFECLGPDLVRSIVAPTTTNNDIPITADIPPELASYAVPAEFEWIGVIAGEMRKIAAFRTDLPIADAQALAAESLIDAGWTASVRPAAQPSPFVFGSGGLRSSGGQVCWNGQSGSMSLRDVDGGRYVNLTWSAQAGQSACRTSGLSARPAPSGAMSEQLPTLRFPAGSSQPNGGGMSGGGSNLDTSMSAQFVSEDSPQALIAVLGRQMIEQGWVADSSWSGRHGAGSTWSRQTDAGERFLGSLEIVAQADESYSVELRLRAF